MSATDPHRQVRKFATCCENAAEHGLKWRVQRDKARAERDEAIAETKRLTDELNDVGAECSRLEQDILEIHDALADPDDYDSAINADWIIERIGQLREAIAERDAAREIIVNLTSNPAGGHYDDCGWTDALALSAAVLSLTEGQEA